MRRGQPIRFLRGGRFCWILICILPLFLYGGETDLRWDWKVSEDALIISLTLPADFYCYADATFPKLEPAVKADDVPKGISRHDPILDESRLIFPENSTVSWQYRLSELTFPLKLSVCWQGCRNASGTGSAMCLMPESRTLGPFADAAALKRNQPVRSAEMPVPDTVDTKTGYSLIRTAEGSMTASEFYGFLTGNASLYSRFPFAGKGFWMTILLVLLGGLALNLTPCVLPLIPVNLAVIGAGQSSEAGRGIRILRGCLYGSGIAVTYGILGVIAALTGSTFGSVNSSWIFNGIAAVLFTVLGLAMFGVFQLDLSRFSSRITMPSGARLTGVFLFGALSALLAGACVAPAVAATLTLASSMAADGNYAGLFLPFLLGFGMALPWPFAAAGMTLFPKPGTWMIRVKQGLGILILCLAGYYLWIAGTLFVNGNGGETRITSGYETILQNALTQSAMTGKPVLLDFGASWCKNCLAMEKQVMHEPRIQQALSGMIVVKLQMDDPSEPSAAAFLRQFKVKGFPSFILLKAE